MFTLLGWEGPSASQAVRYSDPNNPLVRTIARNHFKKIGIRIVTANGKTPNFVQEKYSTVMALLFKPTTLNPIIQSGQLLNNVMDPTFLSTQSLTLFPDNKPNSWTATMPTTWRLQPQEWEIALLHATLPSLKRQQQFKQPDVSPNALYPPFYGLESDSDAFSITISQHTIDDKGVKIKDLHSKKITFDVTTLNSLRLDQSKTCQYLNETVKSQNNDATVWGFVPFSFLPLCHRTEILSGGGVFKTSISLFNEDNSLVHSIGPQDVSKALLDNGFRLFWNYASKQPILERKDLTINLELIRETNLNGDELPAKFPAEIRGRDFLNHNLKFQWFGPTEMMIDSIFAGRVDPRFFARRIKKPVGEKDVFTKEKIPWLDVSFQWVEKDRKFKVHGFFFTDKDKAFDLTLSDELKKYLGNAVDTTPVVTTKQNLS
jgi:hypothetical protein